MAEAPLTKPSVKLGCEVGVRLEIGNILIVWGGFCHRVLLLGCPVRDFLGGFGVLVETSDGHLLVQQELPEG